MEAEPLSEWLKRIVSFWPVVAAMIAVFVVSVEALARIEAGEAKAARIEHKVDLAIDKINAKVDNATASRGQTREALIELRADVKHLIKAVDELKQHLSGNQ